MIKKYELHNNEDCSACKKHSDLENDVFNAITNIIHCT